MRTKERTRDRALPDKPYFTRADLAPRRKDGSVDEEPRVDGVSARGQVSGIRGERTRSVHHGYDVTVLAEVCAVGVWLWEARDRVVAAIPDHGRGRPRECGVADALLYVELAKLFKSFYAVERFVKNRRNWRRLCRAVETAWPNDPSRRLCERPPTRFQFFYLRRNYVSSEVVEELEGIAVRLAGEQATHTGLFDLSLGSEFEPHKAQMAASDGTWELAQTNATSEPYLNRVTGELITRRHDPDAYTYHDRSKPVGNMLVFQSAPGVLPGTSVVLNASYTAGRHEQDSDVAIRMAIDAKKRLPGLRGLAHDKSATGKHREEAFANDIVLINSLPSAPGAMLINHLLGEFHFKHKSSSRDKTKFAIWAIDGHPCIEVHDGNEMVYLQLKRRRHLPRRRHRSGRTILYAEWEIPDLPMVDRELRGATTTLRHNSTTKELKVNKLVSRHLLLISRYDPLYHVLYGTREFAESVNHAYKQCFVNQRARSLGLKNRRLDVLGFTTVFNYESLLMWRKHTGGDISRWFGNYDPDG